MKTTKNIQPLVVLVLLAAAAPIASASDSGWNAVLQVSEDSYVAYFNALPCHAGDDRMVYGIEREDHAAARNTIHWTLAGFGLMVEDEWFVRAPAGIPIFGCNVVATRLGTVDPTREYVVGAHYDSYSFGEVAPGANDNVSGVAAVLEIARVLSDPAYVPAYTIRFVLFDWEEYRFGGHTQGSAAYVDQHANDNIVAMLSLDVIAYNPDTNPDEMVILGQKAPDGVKNALGAAVEEYGYGLHCRVLGPGAGSDHERFEEAGIEACLPTAAEGESYPYLHTDQDFYPQSIIDCGYAARMVRGVVGYLVDAANIDVPPHQLRFDYPVGRPEYLDPRGGTALVVKVVGLGGAIPEPGTAWFHYRYGSVTYSAPMQVCSENLYFAVFPDYPCDTDVEYWCSAADTDGILYQDPPGGSRTPFRASHAYGSQAFCSWDFETAPSGWTFASLWARGTPIGAGGQHGCADPSQAHSGTKVCGYNLTGDYQNSLGERAVSSNLIDCTGRLGVHLTFWRWLGVEAPGFDQARVDAYSDATDWVTAWENDREVSDDAWVPVDLDIEYVADDQSAVKVRWIMGPTDADWTYCGWNIDDVALTELTCQPVYGQGDMDCDGDVDTDDTALFAVALEGPCAYALAQPGCFYMNGDCNGDGEVAADDYDDCFSYVPVPAGKISPALEPVNVPVR
jgi:hypothetical protein